MIPITLFYCVRSWQAIPFRRVVVWFAVFTVCCGLTHLANMLEIWVAWYWFSGAMKLLTAVISVITLAQLLPLIPQVLALVTQGSTPETRGPHGGAATE
jgi:hypothetical protein